jgi:hypothetical protein
MPSRDQYLPPIPPPTCQVGCPPQCENVFDRVHVSYLIRGGTRIVWDLLDSFSDPLPHTFTLQFGRTANSDADDWENVGIPFENTYYAVDGEQRAWGKTKNAHYRIRLSTSRGTYYSLPVAGQGVLPGRDWRLAREIIRKERLRARYAAADGYLLKRRNYGPKCPECLEYQTGEVKDPDCPVCYGTGFQCGYFYPMACVWADLSPETSRKHVDDGGQRGTIQDIVVRARMLNLPQLESYDVWVNARTDDRYYIHTIQSVGDFRGISTIANVELRLAPFTDILYSIPIPQQEAD